MAESKDPRVHDYRSAVIGAYLAADVLAGYDLDEILHAIRMAESVGPLLHPSEWIAKHAAMAIDKRVLTAARALVQVVQEVRAEAQQAQAERLSPWVTLMISKGEQCIYDEQVANVRGEVEEAVKEKSK